MHHKHASLLVTYHFIKMSFKILNQNYLGGVIIVKRLAIIIALFVLAIQTSFNIAESHSSQETTSKRYMEKINLELNGPVKKVTVYPDNGFTTMYYFDASGCLRQKELHTESDTNVNTIPILTMIKSGLSRIVGIYKESSHYC